MRKFILLGKAGEKIVCRNNDNNEKTVSIEINGCSGAYSENIAAVELAKQGLMYKQCTKPIVMEHDFITDVNVPALFIFQQGIKHAPVVFFLHGANGNKAMYVDNALRFASEGYFVVLPDARNHGERTGIKVCKEIEEDSLIELFEVVRQTSVDISCIIDCLNGDDRADTERLGVSGLSMGGMITFMMTITDKRIKAAAPLASTPDFINADTDLKKPEMEKAVKERLKEFDPLTQYRKMPPAAMLVQNFSDDVLIPSRGPKVLDAKLKELYRDIGISDRYRYIEYPGNTHGAPPFMITEVINWFNKFLR